MDPDHTQNLPSNSQQPDYTAVIIDSLKWLQESSEYRHGHTGTEILEVVRRQRPDVDVESLESQMFTLLYNAVNEGLVRETTAFNTLFKLAETASQDNGRRCRACRSPSDESSGEPSYCEGCTHSPRCQYTLPPYLREGLADNSDDEDDAVPSTSCDPNTPTVTQGLRTTREVGTQVVTSEPACSPYYCTCDGYPDQQNQPPRPAESSSPQRTTSCTCTHHHSSEPSATPRATPPYCNCVHECVRRRPRPCPSEGESVFVCSHPKRSRQGSQPARISLVNGSSPEVPRRQAQQIRKYHCNNPKCPNYKKKTGECIIL